MTARREIQADPDCADCKGKGKVGAPLVAGGFDPPIEWVWCRCITQQLHDREAKEATNKS